MKVLMPLSILLLIIVTSCEGAIGPEGPPGPEGQPGVDGEITQAFEVVVDFTPENTYQQIVEMPIDLEVHESDIVMAYVLVDDLEIDVWEPLPQTLFFEEGILLYGYDYTYADVNLFLDGTIDLSIINPDLITGKVFRIAVIPSGLIQSVDVNNMNDVMNFIGADGIQKL